MAPHDGRRNLEDAKMSEADTVVSGVEETPWHAMTADEVEQRFKVDPSQGLEADDAAARLGTYGPNRLPQGEARRHRALCLPVQQHPDLCADRVGSPG
jgi:hypothetical protein